MNSGAFQRIARAISEMMMQDSLLDHGIPEETTIRHQFVTMVRHSYTVGRFTEQQTRDIPINAALRIHYQSTATTRPTVNNYNFILELFWLPLKKIENRYF